MASRDHSSIDPETRRYLRLAMQAPLLSREREADLASQWLDDGDEAALHELISAHIRLVAGPASRYRRLGLPMAELMQEGTLGLLQAANRFDPAREIRFSTYASWWVRAQLQDYLLRNWSVVRIGSSTRQKKLFSRLRRASTGDDATSGMTEAQRQGIADDLGIDLRDVEAMEALALGSDRSFNTPIGDDSGTQLQDLMPDDSPDPEQIVTERHDAALRRTWLESALAKLPERERRIIDGRYLRDDARTLKSLGEELGVSKERVRQLENAALQKIRTFIGDIVERPTG